jgi:hypothetical protein
MVSIEKTGCQCRTNATRVRVNPLVWGLAVVLYSYGIGAVFAYVGLFMRP